MTNPGLEQGRRAYEQLEKEIPKLEEWVEKGIKEVYGEEEAKKRKEEKEKRRMIEEEKTFILTRRGQATKFIEEQPLFYDKAKMWWLWNKNNYCYEIVDETDILNIIDGYKEINTIKSKERMEILEALRQVGRNSIPKPIKETWIQFKDVIIDIKTGEQFRATPEYFVTNPIPWNLHKENYEGTPTIDRIFEEWVGKEYVRTLYEILAYCLIPDYPIHRIFCFIGSGMNGKSKFLELARRFIGANNVTTSELDTLLTSRFEITRLHKKLVCMMGETNFNEMSKTSKLKQLSGGDLIGFEYKGKDPFEDKNYAKIIISTNNLPTTTDKTIGFYRRWMIIDFPNQFSEKKDILGEIPQEEYESLALKSLIVLKELLEVREFSKEGSIEERQKRYEDHSDPLSKFILEYCETGDQSSYLTKYEFETTLNSWLKEHRHREMSDRTIFKHMKESGVEDGKKTIEVENRGFVNQKQVRVWYGIKWKGGSKDTKDVKDSTSISFSI